MFLFLVLLISLLGLGLDLVLVGFIEVNKGLTLNDLFSNTSLFVITT